MFFDQTAFWRSLGDSTVSQLVSTFGEDGLLADRFSLVIVTYGRNRPEGFAHRGDWRCYPCSLVKAFHLVHALHAIETGRVEPHAELDRAMHDMIAWSSNTATNYVIDLLTGTTGDTILRPDELAVWMDKREELNRFFQRLGWPEFKTSNITQKLMDDMRYGREAQFAGSDGRNLNALTALSAARLFHEIFAGKVPLGADARQRAQDALVREREGEKAATPHYQVNDFLGGGVPKNAKLWSKAGRITWTGEPRASYFKHDLIRIEAPGLPAFIIALMTQGKTICEDKPQIFPEIGHMLHDTVTTALSERRDTE